MLRINYSPLKKEAEEYWKWAEKNPPPSISTRWYQLNWWKIWAEMAKGGAGSEARAPLAHCGTVAPVYLAILRYLRKIKPEKGMKLIEIGCGSGRGLSYIKTNFPELEVYGSDCCKGSIEYAQKIYGETGAIFKHIQTTKTQFPDESFDFIISSHVIEHMPKYEGLRFMEEVYRLLKNKGYAFIGTPNREQGQNLYIKNPDDSKKYRFNPSHEHEYTFSELKELGEKIFPQNTKIDILKNKVFNEIFNSSINRIKGRISSFFWQIARDYFPKNLFDGIGTTGASINMKLHKISYYDVLMNNSIEDEKTKDKEKADNFLLVSQKISR